MKHTHHDRKQKMQFALRPLASGIKMTILLPAPPATKLKPVIPPESGHLGRTTFFACNHNGVGPTTRSCQTHACRSNQTLCPMLPWGSPPLQSGGQNQKWPTCGQGGYITTAASGIPTASKRGAESEVAHLWARWLRNPCRLGNPHRFKAGGKIRSGPLVGKVAT